MIANVIFWYLVVALAGWLVFPLAYRLLAFLPDRGLALARPFGLLLWGYINWLLVSLGVLQNNTGGVLVALLIVAGLSLWRLWSGGSRELIVWLKEHHRLVLTTELLFLGLFVIFAIIRAANPEASGTEKPMELAFINSILRSPSFPPSDPWLSGYAISYYYFGYVMVAMLARITGTPGSVAFNLALVTWFSLTGLAAYGLVYNLLAARGQQLRNGARSVIAPLLAPLFVLVVSNLEGFLEVIHALGLFWQNLTGGTAQSGFWKWLNIQELVNPPAMPLTLIPNRPNGIWWWRASRVLQDFDLKGGSREIIDEFPAFSFLLGDLHPHVLSMPFVLLAVGLALNAYLKVRDSADNALNFGRWITTLDFWVAAVVLGGLSFLNTWDFPIYLALFAAAVTLARLAWTGWRWSLLVTFLEVLFSLGIAGGILYLPFYLGFASQANGLLPSLVFFTRGVYFWIMFGALLLPVLAWMIWLVVQRWRAGRLRLATLGQGFLFAAVLIAGLWLLSTLLGLRILGRDPGLAGIWGAGAVGQLLQESITRRIASPGTWLSLLVLLALAWALIQSFRCAPVESALVEEADAAAELPALEPPALEPLAPQPLEADNRADPFVLLLIALGLGLVLFPEFFYLRDQFGWRMNTIFKFYFQAWIVWGSAAAYASVVLFQSLRKPAQFLVLYTAWTALILMALVYPVFGALDRTNHFAPVAWTLDGADFVQRYTPDEMAAIHWLQSAPYGVVAEAVGGSYTGFARVSTFTGLPAVLGWPGHESQWRGGGEEMGTREPDLAKMFKAHTWDQANAILMKYNIRYVYIGSLEESEYRPDQALFQRNLKTVFQNSSVSIYEVPSSDNQQGQAVQP